jgi:hypothetical protein
LEGSVDEELVAWAEDCEVRGAVELPDGRLSDVVNHLDLLKFRQARLEALDDGHVLEMDELEVERRDLHLLLVQGREGDPARRLRTVREKVVMEIGPYTVRGHLHRASSAAPLAATQKWARFIPVTEVEFRPGAGGSVRSHDVILVNRERIAKVDLVDDLTIAVNEAWARDAAAAFTAGP